LEQEKRFEVCTHSINVDLASPWSNFMKNLTENWKDLKCALTQQTQNKTSNESKRPAKR